MKSFDEKIAEMAEAYTERRLKEVGGSMTVADYVNSDELSTAFESGSLAAREILQGEFDRFCENAQEKTDADFAVLVEDNTRLKADLALAIEALEFICEIDKENPMGHLNAGLVRCRETLAKLSDTGDSV